MKKIAILGGGNLGQAIAYGLYETQHFEPQNIIVTRRRIKLLAELAETGMSVSSDNCQAVKDADMVIICVKPREVKGLLKEIKDCLKPDKHILASTATGVSIETMLKYLGKKIPTVRAMPNTAIAIRESMTCLAVEHLSEKQEEQVVALFEQLGQAVIIKEDLMGAATVLGGAGIAFALRYIRAASQGGVEIGFDAKRAQVIAAQTVLGAARLILEQNDHPEREIDKVTTPRGITISGINEMEHQGFSSALIKGLLTSFNKMERIQKST